MRADRNDKPGRRRTAARGRRNREHEVLDAAVEIFWRKGYSAASVQEVADAVGVLKGSLYHYISSKEELLFRIFEENHTEALVIMDAVSALQQDALGRLREYVIQYVTYYLDNIKRVGLYYREWRFIGGERGAVLRMRRRDYDNFVQKLLQESINDGQLPVSTDPKLATYFIIAAINGIADWYRPGGSLSAAEIARSYADLVLATVGARASR